MTETRTVETARRGDVVRFTPEASRRRVTVIVDDVTTEDSAHFAFVHGVRCNAEGHVDSQARRHCWPVRHGSSVEVVA